jgi:hypothetical protein|tara:strand:- start:93 stop:641 length:549 start_codon:yes stop_codon:yes gene_type:complete
MGKRSNFKRVARDFYPTPLKAVIPLIPHLKEFSTFVEPCAGDGSLIDILEDHGMSCTSACDIAPQREDIATFDAINLTENEVGGQCIITNPPWDRKLLHKLIPLFTALRPTWLLFDADWLYTVQSAEFLPLLKKVVAVGRVKWIPDSASQGKDNASWYFFNNRIKKDPEFVSFYGRVDLNNP